MYCQPACMNTEFAKRKRNSSKRNKGSIISLSSISSYLFYVSLSILLSFSDYFSLSSFLSLLPFSVRQPSAISCLDKLMYKFPQALHHGWLPYQGQESALQHLKHFIGILSSWRGKRGNKPVGWNSLVKLVKPFTVFDDRPWVSLMCLVLKHHTDLRIITD